MAVALERIEEKSSHLSGLNAPPHAGADRHRAEDVAAPMHTVVGHHRRTGRERHCPGRDSGAFSTSRPTWHPRCPNLSLMESGPRRTVPLWTLIVAIIVVIGLSAGLGWTGIHLAETNETLESAQDAGVDLIMKVSDYSDAVDQCQATMMLWAKAADTQNAEIQSIYDSLTQFFNSWSYKSGDVQALYSDQSRPAAASSAALFDASQAGCSHP